MRKLLLTLIDQRLPNGSLGCSEGPRGPTGEREKKKKTLGLNKLEKGGRE